MELQIRKLSGVTSHKPTDWRLKTTTFEYIYTRECLQLAGWLAGYPSKAQNLWALLLVA